MNTRIFPTDKAKDLGESLKGIFGEIGEDAEITYYFVLPELYEGSQEFAKSVFDENIKNTLFVFLITEDSSSFQDYYGDFVFFSSHYPAIFIKLPQESSRLIQLANISKYKRLCSLLEKRRFLPFSEIRDFYISISEEFSTKWAEDLEKKEREKLYQQLSEASKLRAAANSLLVDEHISMGDGILPSFDRFDDLYRLYFEKDFTRNLLFYDKICQLVTPKLKLMPKKNSKDKVIEEPTLNILIVDDNPKDFEGILLKIGSMFTLDGGPVFTFHYPKDGWANFTEQICMQRPGKDVKAIQCSALKDVESTVPKQLSDMDFVLLDLHFRGKTYTGQRILKQLNNAIPELPIFILTKSHDIDMIRDVFSLEADCFISKNRLVALPYYIYKFYKEAGLLLCCLQSPQRRHFLGRLRYWKQHPDFLWFGDKCYHMVNHSFDHVDNDWRLANQLLYPILLRNAPETMFSEDLYCLCMAVWLHDIGHKGNERYGDPHEIRDNHGIISGELILTQPELLGIYDYTEDYKDMAFPFGPMKKPVVQVIKEMVKERIKELGDGKLSIVEKIALISIYHKSNAPLSKSDYRQMVSKDKYIPKEYFTNGDKTKKEITLTDITNDKLLHKTVALFRFIDGLDINRNRVGDFSERDLKTRVVNQDLDFQLSKLKARVKSILKQNSTEERKQDGFVGLSLIKMFYQDVEEKIKRGEFVSHIGLSKLVEDIGNLELEELEDYFMLLNYASFLSVQNTHFDLHSSIDRIEIEHSDPSEPRDIKIHYYSNQTMKILKEKKVRELRKVERPIKKHLIGTKEMAWRDGYVFDELNKGKELLNSWFNVDDLGVFLHDSEGKKEPKT